MRKAKFEFVSLALFLVFTTLILTNGFVARIFADETQIDIVRETEPIGVVLDEILRNYVNTPDVPRIVEGALMGMMNTLDTHSAYLPPQDYDNMAVETEGEFDGIGVSIKQDNDKNIYVNELLSGEAPAAKAGLRPGDRFLKIDDESAQGMSLSDAARLIRGRRGTPVRLRMLRQSEDATWQVLDFEIIRGPIPLTSISEARVLDGGIGYIHINDFKKNTAAELRKKLAELEEQGMKSLVLDLRWNPGGLLTSSREVCELFLPKDTLVTYTEGRKAEDGTPSEYMEFYTKRDPVFPLNRPLIILTSDITASSSEIVTGALQYHRRAIVIGEKTYGKGSVQTLIRLRRPEGSALRLTTALYYTPAHVTINNEGIKPDVEVNMDWPDESLLLEQMRRSIEEDPANRNAQNHGSWRAWWR